MDEGEAKFIETSLSNKFMADVTDVNSGKPVRRQVEMTEDQRTALNRAVRRAQKSTEYKIPELIKSYRMVEVSGGPAPIASLAVTPKGVPFLEVSPRFFDAPLFKNSPDTQQLAIIHEIVHAEDYPPHVRAAGGWSETSFASYEKAEAASEASDVLFEARE